MGTIAGSFVAITPGSGANVDTFTQPGGDHRQAVVLGDATAAQTVSVGVNGGLAVKSAMIPSTTGNIAAGAGTGTIGPMDVSEAGAVTIIVKNQTAGTAFGTGMVLVFEQSDDSTSWSPMGAVRNDNNQVGSTWAMPANAANVEFVFDAACEAINYVRVRWTVGPATNPATVVIAAGGHPFSPAVTVATQARQMITGGMATAGAGAGTTATDVMLTFTATLFRNYVSMGTASSFAISAGKSLRITAITVGLLNSGAVVTSAVFTLRTAAAGATSTASPVVAAVPIQLPATTGLSAFQSFQYGDGLDIPGNAAGTNTFGVSVRPVWATNAPTLYCWITGYEY